MLNRTIVGVASYDFGVVKPMLSFTSSKVAGVNYSSVVVAATAPAGQSGLLKAQYSHMNDVDTATAGRQAYDKFALGYQYNLTKSVNFFGQVSDAKEKSLSATNTLELGMEYGF